MGLSPSETSKAGPAKTPAKPLKPYPYPPTILPTLLPTCYSLRKMRSAVPLLKYSDYRGFLLAHAQDMKTRNPNWSYGTWARRLGLRTTSSITKIIQGSRNPDEAITKKLVTYFEFSEEESQFFRDLVQLHKVKRDPRLTVLILEKIEQHHPTGSALLLDEKRFSVISDWYCYAIREMANLDRFFASPQWISRKLAFPVPAIDVARAIDNLVTVGLLKRDRARRLCVADGTVETSQERSSEAIKRFHEQTLENAKQAVRLFPVEEREFHGSTFVMNREDLPVAKEMIRKFRKRFTKTFERPKADSVFQIHVSLFPLTRKDKT